MTLDMTVVMNVHDDIHDIPVFCINLKEFKQYFKNKCVYLPLMVLHYWIDYTLYSSNTGQGGMGPSRS